MRAVFGAQAVTFLGDFEPPKTGDPTEYGTPMRFSAVVKKPVAEYLREVCGNRERRVTFSRYVGVLEFLWVQNRPDLQGVYLFQNCNTNQTHMEQLKGWMSFSLDAVKLPNRPLVVVRSARAKDNDFGVTPQSLVVQPLWGETSTGEPFEIDPGGTAFSREYDHRTAYDASSLFSDSLGDSFWDEGTWDDPEEEWSGVLPGRRLRIHAGTV